ncbi:MAG TPA: ATP-binding protein [Myxococcota bacterium]|nr:ATP-binding protein [Myxococcota bacterium]
MGAAAAAVLLVAFLSLRGELAARRFARLTLAYGLWCTGCAARGLGADWGAVLADLSLCALGPLSLACAAALAGRPAIAPRFSPAFGATVLALAGALLLFHPAPPAVHVAAHLFALGCVAASAFALWRNAPASADGAADDARADEAASPEARRVRYVIVAHSIAVGGVLLDVLMWQLSLPRVASLLFPLLYLYAGYLHLTQVRVADLRQLVGNTVALSVMAVGLAAFFAAIRLWVGERLDLFVFNAFVASFALLLFFAPMRDRIQGAMELRFLAGKVALERGLRPLRERLKHILTLDELLTELLAAVEKAELFRASAIYLRDDATLGFQLAGSIGLPTRTRVSLLSEPVWVSTVEVVDVLQREELERRLDDPKNAAERPRLEVLVETLRDLEAELVLPLRAKSQVVGFWTLADARSRESFSSEEVRLLRQVADQIATSLENSKTFERVRARDRFVSLGEMAAGLAHEIRNPLAAIRGAVAVLQQPTDAKSAELWGVIIEEIARLNRVVESFLDYARPATRPAAIRDVAAFVKSCAEAVSRSKGRSDVEFALELDPGLPELRADADQLERVVVNVVQNAYEALEGRGRVRVALRRGAPGPLGDDWLEIQVDDDGPGMSDTTLERAFIPFYTTKQQGTGLGLALCERLIRAQGGTIQLRSRPGEGTSVLIRLPVEAKAAEEPA